MQSYSHPLAGLQVLFPYENPYPQQKVMMSRLITALKQKKNCLIESPTGTGKSLSLLCAALSFREDEKRKFVKGLTEFPHGIPTSTLDESGVNLQNGKFESTNFKKSVMDMYEEECVKLHNESAHKSLLNEKSQASEDVRILKPPKIFYGTRTHRQVSQVVAEFHRTGYQHMKMTILGSRDRLCVSPKALSSAHGVNEECRNFRKESKNGHGCRFMHRLQKINRHSYPTQIDGGKVEPWDIEDIITVGKRHSLCPYYWSIQLAEEADIVFCPYQYILDPRTRKAVDIHLENNIVILDEAHNIEDICRDAMGAEINLSDILHLEALIDTSIKNQTESPQLMQISPSIGALRHVLLTEAAEVPLHSPKQLNSTQVCELLEVAGLGPKSWPRSEKVLQELLNENVDTSDDSGGGDVEQKQERTLDTRSRIFFDAISNTMGHMYKMDLKFIDCFRAAISKKIAKDSQKELQGSCEITLQIYCLNPAVALVDIREKVHSFVVASGTLSPMKSFQCELDIPFPFSVSLNHVVKEEQLLACVVATGPSGRAIVCDYKNNSEFALQDDLGESLLRIASRVPNGVLCFFPSYALMNKLRERWELTGLWKNLEGAKKLFVEGKMKFQQQMDDYYESSLSAKGSLLFAVCRGRVSEGEDFPDNFARAVIVVGIPFPNVREVTVGDKMAFNDMRLRNNHAVMSGSDWYKTQAFRALNQAIGRCIRHSNDWGAIILLETRVSSYRGYKEMLSRWVRERLVDINSFDELESRLENFVDERKHEAIQSGSSGLSRREEAKLSKAKAVKRKTSGGVDFGQSQSKPKPKLNYPLFNPPLKRKTWAASKCDPSSCSLSADSESRVGSSSIAVTAASTRLSDDVVTIVESPEKLISPGGPGTSKTCVGDSHNWSDDDSSDIFSE